MNETGSKLTASNLRPFHLLTSVLLFSLGAGIADYLGWEISPGIFLLGQLWLVSLQLGFFLFGDYIQIPLIPGLFEHLKALRGLPAEVEDEEEEKATESRRGKVDSQIQFWLAVLLLLLVAGLTTLMGYQQLLSPISITVMSMLFVGYAIYVVPDLVRRFWMFREVTFSLLLVVLPVGLGYTLQTGDYHRLLSLSAFPLYPLHLAFLLVLQLISYRDDLASRKKTLFTAVGWVRGVVLHNYLIITGFLILGVSLFFDFPLTFVLPSMAALFPGAYLVWYLNRLKKGAPERRALMLTLSLITFFVPVYYLLFSYWSY